MLTVDIYPGPCLLCNLHARVFDHTSPFTISSFRRGLVVVSYAPHPLDTTLDFRQLHQTSVQSPSRQTHINDLNPELVVEVSDAQQFPPVSLACYSKRMGYMLAQKKKIKVMLV